MFRAVRPFFDKVQVYDTVNIITVIVIIITVFLIISLIAFYNSKGIDIS